MHLDQRFQLLSQTEQEKLDDLYSKQSGMDNTTPKQMRLRRAKNRGYADVTARRHCKPTFSRGIGMLAHVHVHCNE